MRIIKFVADRSVALFVIAVLAGAVSGITSMGVLILLFRLLSAADGGTANIWLLASCAAVAIGSRALSRELLDHIGRDAILRMRLRLSQQIASIPLIEIERIGNTQLINAFTGDLGRVAGILPSLVTLCSNGALLATCLVYLCWLSPTRMLTVLAIVGLGVLCYYFVYGRAIREMRIGQEIRDRLLDSFRTLLDGIKEIKLSRVRRREALDVFARHASDMRRSGRRQANFFGGAASVTQLLVYAALGLVVFDFNGGITPQHILIGYTISIIYMVAPLQAIMEIVRNLVQANVAMERITRLGLSLDKARYHSEDELPVGGNDSSLIRWRELQLAGITHSYSSGSDAQQFALGPIDWTLHPGEVAFIVGGNGSGKTTLAKLITGLYFPSTGEIRLDGCSVTQSGSSSYRQNFSAVFGDFHLFERLLESDGADLEVRVPQLMQRLQLEGRVRVENGVLSTTTALSLGESKRLALMSAYLEDRPIFLFDEWAADQDPQFKDVFYNEMLAELRGRGKLVIVISHDDRYFRFADKILTLERGMPARYAEHSTARTGGLRGVPPDAAADLQRRTEIRSGAANA